MLLMGIILLEYMLTLVQLSKRKKKERYVDSSPACMPLYMNWLGNI
jgi:hypothetical protein